MSIVEKWKGFGIGLAMTGIAVVTTAAPQGVRNLCTGACSQCCACGLTALPLVLWLAGKRWLPAARARNSIADVMVRVIPPDRAAPAPIPNPSAETPERRSTGGAPGNPRSESPTHRFYRKCQEGIQ